MITSRLTSKAQTTIPRPVRAALALSDGDQIAYTITEHGVVLTRVPTPPGIEDPFHAFSEWHGAADTQAYAKL